MPFFKRLFRFSFFLVILGTLFVASASAACVGVGTVNTSALRLRGEPSSDGEILATVNQGEAVVVLEQVDADWYKVDHRTVEGYMLAEFLDVAATSDKELGYGVVSVNDTYFLNVRLALVPITTKSPLFAIGTWFPFWGLVMVGTRFLPAM